MTDRIILGTRNPHKVREIAAVLEEIGVEVLPLPDNLDIEEPIEDGADFTQNARIKAMHYAQATGGWCLADDSGLAVDALDGEPGVHSARYAAENCPDDASRDELDAANNTKLLEELKDVPPEKRTARFVCHLALTTDKDVLLEAEGKIEGRIIDAPAGSNGFGYDPLFYLDDRGCTTAELAPQEKNSISHRGNALRIFAEKLKTFLESR